VWLKVNLLILTPSTTKKKKKKKRVHSTGEVLGLVLDVGWGREKGCLGDGPAGPHL
jgi:hypothetical protein